MDNYHELFTDESNTVIKLEELINKIKNLDIELQNKILEDVLEESSIINEEYKKQIKKYEILEHKRQVNKKSKNNLFSDSKESVKHKKYINNKIDDYKDDLEKILSFDLYSLKKYIDELNDNYSLTKEYIIYLMLGILREIKNYEEISENAFKDNDLDFINEIKNEIKVLKDKKDLLNRYKDNIKIENKETKCTRIIFLETTSKRSYFFEDIEGYVEFYDSYYKLLKSLVNNNPLNLRKFTNDDNTLVGLSEVRDIEGQTRIFYDKVDSNTYIIINAIIKKEYKSYGYKNQLKNRYKLYLQEKNNIIKNLENSEFKERQDGYFKQIEELLTKSTNRLVLKKEDNDE